MDRIVFAVGFLEEEDYEHPGDWEPNEDNFIVRVVEPVPMKEYKAQALAWYDRYIKKGVTPQWTAEDTYLVDEILKNCGY